MPNTASQVVVTKNEDGSFKVESDSGNVINYTDKELVLALEEVVNQFRGVRPKIYGIKMPTQTSPAVPAKKVERIIDADTAAEKYYNGGLGRLIEATNTDGSFGLGV